MSHFDCIFKSDIIFSLIFVCRQMIVPIHHPLESIEDFPCVFQIVMRDGTMEVTVVFCEDILKVGETHFEGSLDGTTPHRNDGASVGAWHSIAEHADVVSSVVLIVVIFGAERIGHKCNREIDISLTVDASLDKFQIRFHNVFSFHKINFDFAYSKVRLRIIRAGQ